MITSLSLYNVASHLLTFFLMHETSNLAIKFGKFSPPSSDHLQDQVSLRIKQYFALDIALNFALDFALTVHRGSQLNGCNVLFIC